MYFPNVAAQTSTTSGTADFVVSGSVFGHRTLVSALVNGREYAYRAYYADGVTAGWEIGRGVWTSSSSTLARTTIEDSSAAGAKVSFSGASKIIEVTISEAQLDAAKSEAIIIAVGDETTDATTGTAKVTFRMPYKFTLTGIKGSLTTAATGSSFIMDVNVNGSTLMTTNKVAIDAGEETTDTAATAPTLTTTALSADDEITVDVDQVGATTAGAGPKITLIGFRTL